ncbi:MAG: colicin V production protein [Polaribacter sp.]|nr:MAG: colicin V production protein [Polaribacter sp.]
MNTFDIIIASVLVFGLVRGLFKGFFVEVASLVAIFLGVYGTIHFSFFVSDYLKDTVSWDDSVVQLVSFCITFMFILLAVSLLGKLLTKIIDFAELGLLNRIVGGIFGALKFGLILSVVFIFFDNMNNTIPFVKQEVLNQSILYKPVKQVAPMIFPSVIKDVE